MTRPTQPPAAPAPSARVFLFRSSLLFFLFSFFFLPRHVIAQKPKLAKGWILLAVARRTCTLLRPGGLFITLFYFILSSYLLFLVLFFFPGALRIPPPPPLRRILPLDLSYKQSTGLLRGLPIFYAFLLAYIYPSFSPHISSSRFLSFAPLPSG